MKKPIRNRRAPAGEGPGRAHKDETPRPRAPRKSSHGSGKAAKRPAGKLDTTVTVVNRRGLHARAAAKFVKLASQFAAEIRVTAKGGLAGGATVSGRSIMGLMMLAAGPGSSLHIEAEGADAAAALAALTTLVDSGFEEVD